MHKVKTRELTLCGMLSAAVAVGTMAIAVPVPATNGFINLGDGIILTAAYLLGGYYAMLAGAIGSALADILLGYAQWAPFTLLIKGLMGFVAVKLFISAKSPFSAMNVATVIAVELIMVFGYYTAGSIMLSSFAAALAEVPANVVQGVGALCIYSVLAPGLKKVMKR